MNALLFFVCVFTFRVDYEMYSFCRYGNFPYEKYLRLEEDEQLWFVQDKHYELSVELKNVRCF